MKLLSRITIYKAGSLSGEDRTHVANWLRKEADKYERDGANYSLGRYVARKFEVEKKDA